MSDMLDITPVVQPFGPGKGDVKITDMTGKDLASAIIYLEQHGMPSDHPWLEFLRYAQRKFRKRGGKANDCVDATVKMSPGLYLGFLRGNVPPDEA
jgi:hypothetical protein